MSLSRFILTSVFCWKIVGPFPDIPKSITIFAPHTSYLDALLGMLFGLAEKVNFVYFIKKTFFWFPLNILLKKLGGVPVQGVKDHNAIYEAIDLINKEPEIHIVISPEGTMAARSKWNKGFLLIARKAQVPVTVAYLDFKKKEIGIKGVINNLGNAVDVMEQIKRIYEGVTARNPEQFVLHSE